MFVVSCRRRPLRVRGFEIYIEGRPPNAQTGLLIFDVDTSRATLSKNLRASTLDVKRTIRVAVELRDLRCHLHNCTLYTAVESIWPHDAMD